jgi:tellurite resistance-related uncharacterized protein
MPSDLALVRTTPEFTATNVPAGLLATHQVAAATWGRLCVRQGSVTFVFEDAPDQPVHVAAGAHVDIPPARLHHVEPAADAVFEVEFYR